MPQVHPTFQEVILRLQTFWGKQGCALLQPYDIEVGAGTFHTYFAVPDVANTTVRGLEQTTLIDRLDKASRKYQHGEVTLAAATNRISLDVPVRQTFIGSEAAIIIDSECHCTVV